MKILAIDTSGEQAGAAIVSSFNSSYITVGEIFLNARTGEKSWTHSEILMPGVRQLFELTRISPDEIDFVAYTNGPGSFTGLRIGAACALGIARALGKLAIPVPTLDALAYNMIGTGTECVIVPMLDARRGQVYTALYYRNGFGDFYERRTEFMALSADDLISEFLADISAPIMFLGDGADANAILLHDNFPAAIFPRANNNRQRAASVAVCAAEKIQRGEDFSSAVEILYVRAPQAVREAAARKK